MKKLSIIICSYNRKAALQNMLDQLVAQISDQDLEIVLVDNNSTDGTKELLQGYSQINYVLETEQGSSAARNRGIKEAQGQLLAFLDDDIDLDENWLAEVYKVAESQPNNLVFGTRVIPVWEIENPDWLSIEAPYEIIQSCFPAHDYGDMVQSYPFAASEKRQVQNPISACFLCSRDVFEKHGDFRLDLGIHGNKRGACEDTEFFWRLQAAGQSIEYYPAIKIYHPIVKEKMTQESVLAWYRLLGETLQYMQMNGLAHLSDKKAPSKFSLQFRLFALSIINLFNFLMNPKQSFWFKSQASKLQGALATVCSE